MPDIPLPIHRPRRNRKSEAIRSLARESELTAAHLVLPIFVHEDTDDVPIASMPGCHRLGQAGLIEQVTIARSHGVAAVVLFPALANALKRPDGREAWNPDGLVPRLVDTLKQRWPDLVVITDVALDPYSSDGHDGIVAPDGRILNDETLDVLCRQALCHARAGADVVAPSDMMDGRVAAIRSVLDGESFTDVSILAYSAKYASAFYGPFREALDSAPRHGDKRTYQMDPANVREAVREVLLDVDEGADMVMIKPALPYLDVIARVRGEVDVPVAAYQVSGEYTMIMAACQNGWIDEQPAILESLRCIRRAGADFILTYFASRAAAWL